MNEANRAYEDTMTSTKDEEKGAEEKTPVNQNKEKERQENLKGILGRTSSSITAQKPKDQKKIEVKSHGRGAMQDKDVISWLNKKIVKQDGIVFETQRNANHSKTKKLSQTLNKSTMDKAQKWRDQTVGFKGTNESLKQNPGYIKSECSKDRRNKSSSKQSYFVCDKDSQKHMKYCHPVGRSKRLANTKYQKEMQLYKKELESHDFVQVGADGNVTNEKFGVESSLQAEQYSENSNALEKLAGNGAQFNQQPNIGLQPQVYVYGGLHVYNMPYMDQQYYSGGYQWYNYGENWAQPFIQQPQNSHSAKDRKSVLKEEKDSKSYSTQLRHQTYSVMVDPNHSVQASVLTEQLLNESYECMICCEKIRCHASVWSCVNCYHVFHLRCVKKWANSPAALVEGDLGGWRCPACQNINQSMPSVYRCFCGKSIDPKWSRSEGITPHSCGELCQKKRDSSDCPHLCNQLCHPGPCPSCPVMISKSCMCGKMSQQTRCGQTTIIQCKEICSKSLNCGVHSCERLCHAGDCDVCEVDEEQACYCGKTTRQTKCGTGELSETDGKKGYFSCNRICPRFLDCGNHKCEKACHTGECEPCKLKPSIVSHCPCGKTSLGALLPEQRQSCFDPIPTCSNVCNKLLPCSPTSGDLSSQHRCKLPCHYDDCGPCDGKTTVFCRCGGARKEINCAEISDEVYLCEQRCNKKRHCGRHRCNQKCCVDKHHQCELVCGKKLRCGIHKCEEPCHRGYCPPCFMTGFEEVACHCGSTVMYPPIPCGTPLPECTKPCSRLHACSHPVNHLCHSEEVCPPCTTLTKKMCSGNHQLRLNVPCHVTDVSCGTPCGSRLKCGHKCIKLCHKPPCDSEPCMQPCEKQRTECGHLCGLKCHHGSPCPDNPCQVKITIACKCGRRSENVPCLQGGDKTALAQFYQRMTTESLANKMKGVQLGQSIDISTVIMLDEKSVRYIECNDECAHMERVRRMAVALGIEEHEESPVTQRILYSPFLMNEAKNNLTFIKSIEEAFESLVTVARKLSSGQKSHSFPPMNSNQRRIIHELAVHYSCSSVSYDAEPKRNTVITAYKKSHCPPFTLSSQVERQKNPPPPPPMPYVPSDAIPKARMIKDSKAENKPKTWAQVPDYFADDFED